MEKNTKRYDKLEQLGEGTYGVVYKAQDTITKQLVALKKVKTESTEDEGIPATTLREFSVLKRLKHKNIVRLLDVLISSHPSDHSIHLVFEFHPQDLRSLLKNLKNGESSPLPIEFYQEKFL